MPELSRRGFLGTVAAALVLDPERALWVPGKKLISVPKAKMPLIEMVEIRGSHFGVANICGGDFGIESLEARIAGKFPGRELFSFQGQRIFPSCDMDGTVGVNQFAYVLAADWKTRMDEYAEIRVRLRPDHIVYA
jgi:hypothetical protein